MRYRAKVQLGSLIEEIEVEAQDNADLEAQVRAWGMTLLDASQAERGPALRLRRQSKFDRTLFTQELLTLLGAGLSLIETIETLRDKAAAGTEQGILDGIASALYEGLPLSRALERQPDVFPPLYVATVASAERTGHLVDALRRYHAYDAKLAATRKKVVSSLVYPVMVIAVGGLILLFLLFYVIPKFSQIYASMSDLPPAARLMLWWGDLVKAHGGKLMIGLLVFALGAVAALRSEAVRARLLELFWRLPFLQRYRRLFALTGFYRTMGLLMAGGVAVVPALGLSRQLLPGNLRALLEQAGDAVGGGQPLSLALEQAGLTTPVAGRLLRVGEQSGDLAKMMTHAAEFSDDELDRAIDMLMRLVEPLLMLVVGTLIGVIVFLLYMPIFELAGNVG